MTRRRSAYSMPGGRAGIDDFRGKQEPQPEPVDALSRFVLDRIRDAETKPAIEVMAVYDQPAGPMAHRYAGHVRRDMVAFREIVALYVYYASDVDAGYVIQSAMLAIANRWSEHPEFRDEWRLA